MLAIIETHPVQYHAPVYRCLQERFGIPVTAIYGSDFSIAGYRDRDFGETFSWDTDLLAGYHSIFLSRAQKGEMGSPDKISARGLAKALSATNPSAILLIGYSLPFYRSAFWMLLKTKRPLLFRGETNDRTGSRSYFKALLRKGFLSWFYRHFSRLLYVGEYSREHFKRIGFADGKLVFSPYCVDLKSFEWDETARSRWRLSVRQKLRIPMEKKVLLFCGKMVFWKGPDLFLQAVMALPAAIRKETAILFVGDGPMRKSLERSSCEAADAKACFVGFQNQTQLSPYYHAADLLVLPSRSEPWGLVVNEALHHGLPCVVSEAVGCTPDLIEAGVTGEIFKTDSAESLSLAVGRGMKLIARPEIREKCRKKVGGYTVEKAAQGIAEAYFSTVGSLVR